jgi:hypothetical protein
MGVNLAEGCGAVNAATLGLFCLSRLSGLSGLFDPSGAMASGSFCCLTRTRQTDRLNRPDRPVPFELCSLGAFLYKNACAGH